MKRFASKFSVLLALSLSLTTVGCGATNTGSTEAVGEETEAIVETAGTEAADTEAAAADDGEYLYGYTEMSFADFWYGEIEEVAAVDSFDTPDDTLTSEAYLRYSYSSVDDEDPYAGVQKEAWDNDSGMYDAISRATVGYGIFRGGFAHTVEVTMDDGTVYRFASDIVEDESAPTGYDIQVNINDVPGIVLSDITRIDVENTTGYTPDTTTTFAETGVGYQITGLRHVPVKVKQSTIDAARALVAEGTATDQVVAFLERVDAITPADISDAYAVKELYASGVYGPREIQEDSTAKDVGNAYLGDGSNGTKAVAHGDGYADFTMFIYLDNYEGYTRGSIASLDEATLDTLYEEEEVTTYAANKEAADKLAAFMDYALSFQGAKLQWAGEDGIFDTEDDAYAGNMLHKDSYFSFNHGNYIEISVTNAFDRFENLGNGNYRVTLIADGYTDAVVEVSDVVLDYAAPVLANEDVDAVTGDTLTVDVDASSINVSMDEAVQAAYLEGLEDASAYSLYYMEGSGRNATRVDVAEAAAEVSVADGIYTVSFDVSGADLPEDIHYYVGIASGQAEVADVTLEFHYAPAE